MPSKFEGRIAFKNFAVIKQLFWNYVYFMGNT